MSKSQTGIRYAPVKVPAQVSIEDGLLNWQDDITLNAQHRRPNDSTLLAFSRLHREGEDRIAAFAAKHGVLRASQVKPEYARSTDRKLTDGSIWRLGTSITEGREPLGLWSGLSRQIFHILRINASLKGRAHNPTPTVGTVKDWRALGSGQDDHDINEMEVEEAQFFFSLVVNEWLALGGVGLELGLVEYSKKTTDWRLDVTYSGLAGGLAYRLLLTVVGESSLFACSGCGTPYIRTARAPKPGEENFCPDCKDVARARALKRYREKNR